MIKHGFSLIELMIVIAIIGILTAMSYPFYHRYIIRVALTQYHTELMYNLRRIEQEFIVDGDSDSLVVTAASILCNDQPTIIAHNHYTCKNGTLKIHSDKLQGNKIILTQNYEPINVGGLKWIHNYNIGITMQPDGTMTTWGYGLLNTNTQELKRIRFNYAFGNEASSYRIRLADGSLQKLSTNIMLCEMKLVDKNSMPVPKSMRPSNCKYFSPYGGNRILTEW